MSYMLQLYIDQALALTDRGEMAASIEPWQAAVRLAPMDAWLHYNLAVALQSAERIVEAVEEYRETLVLDPSYWEPHFRIGTLYWERKQWPEAIACFRRVLAIDPEQTEALRSLAGALYDQARATKKWDDWWAAYEALREVKRACPDSLQYPRRTALAEWHIGNRDAALAQMQALAAETPQDYYTLFFLAWMQRKSRQWRAYWETLGRMSPLVMRRWGLDTNGNRLEKPEQLP